MSDIDFLAVGDIVTDDFIALEDAHIENEPEGQELCMRFGDKLPYKESVVVRAVGNSPNASVSAHRLGLKSALLTDLGKDERGQGCIDALTEEGVSTEFVRSHEGIPSNYHYVLRFKAERTILVKHHEYPYAWPEFESNPKWIYLSSLGENSLPYHEAIADFLEKNPDVKLAFQPGTFQIKLGSDTLKKLYEHAHLFFCNKEEAQRILNTKEDDITKLLDAMHDLGPVMPIITDGPRGAYVRDEDGSVWHGPMYPDPAPPVDRTGAGDSFSSTFTCALALGHDVATALQWGPINSMSVVQHIGAQKGLLPKDKLLQYLAEAPEDYVSKKIR